MTEHFNDCPVCLDAHDDEIHEATLRLHQWFRNQISEHLAWVALEGAEPVRVEAA